MSKAVLITGGAKRIGKSIAEVLWTKGWNIILHYRSSSKDAMSLVNNFNSKRADSAFAIKADLDDPKEVEKLVADTLKCYGSLDALINNASTFFATPISEINNKNWEALINSNLKAPIFLIAGLADAIDKNKGNIINITDINVERGLANHSIYIAAKAGLDAITKIFARDLSPNIRVNAIAPGAILEPPGVSWTKEQKQKIIRKVPLKKMGDETDISNAVLFLIESDYVTGQIINVDGGKSII